MRLLLRLVLGVAALLVGACGDAPPAANVPDTDVFFPTYPRGPVVMAALFQGPLVVENGCVLMGNAGDYALPVWPDGFTAERDETGQLIVQDADGATIAIEGEVFEMGGGYRTEFYPGEAPRDEQIQQIEEFLGYEIPQQCLGGDVYGIWLTGETQPLAD